MSICLNGVGGVRTSSQNPDGQYLTKSELEERNGQFVNPETGEAFVETSFDDLHAPAGDVANAIWRALGSTGSPPTE